MEEGVFGKYLQQGQQLQRKDVLGAAPPGRPCKHCVLHTPQVAYAHWYVHVATWCINESCCCCAPRSPAELLARVLLYTESVPGEEQEHVLGAFWHFLCPAAARAYFALIPMQQEVSFSCHVFA
jgi:hypothetical protein